MEIHFMIVVSMETSFSSKHHPLYLGTSSPHRESASGLGRPRKDLPASGYDVTGDRVEGRVGNLIGSKLRISLHHFRQSLLHFGIGSEVIGFRVLLLIPQTDSQRFRSAWNDERNFVLEAFLLCEARE